ncbi:MAG: hypothetical protein MOGMAGMI_01788 [Candidatus Omnitrophica bacterium]|nr:hypothetical protein [Candidatus Omnitrophota bacterium]
MKRATSPPITSNAPNPTASAFNASISSSLCANKNPKNARNAALFCRVVKKSCTDFFSPSKNPIIWPLFEVSQFTISTSPLLRNPNMPVSVTISARMMFTTSFKLDLTRFQFWACLSNAPANEPPSFCAFISAPVKSS